jgi:hypothetical protein
MPFDFYISNKFYQKPDFDKYEQAKTAFYQDFYSCSELTHLEKWDELNEKFKLLVANRPQFAILVERRKTTDPGRFSLSLDDFLLFMENFYFLLTAENDYQLAQEQKRILLNGVEEISSGGLCEPGLATRCNELLVQFRSDMSWIDSELFKQRKNIIKLLADEYNASHRVSESLSVHTHMCMQQFSEIFKLGADDDVKIADVYLRVSSTKPMEDYFKANYQTRFKVYQKEYLDGLMAHLWSVFEKDYKDKFSTDGQRRIKVLDGKFIGSDFVPSPNTTLLKEFLGKYLEGDDSLNSLVIEDEETSEYCLKSTDEFKNGLREALLKKLVNDGFLINRDKLSEENVKCLHLFYDENISQHLMKAFLVDFGNRDIAKNVDKYSDILMANTDFLADLILSDTIQLDFLSKHFKHHHAFIRGLIKSINISEDQLFLKLSLEIMNMNTGYYFLFSEEQRQKFQRVYQEQFPELFINLEELNLFGDVLKNKVSWYQLRKYSFIIPNKLENAMISTIRSCH